MSDSLWFAYFYQPLFNALIWIYSNWTNFNLGWAVVWLTIFLRLFLLPFTIISEYNNVRRQKAVAEAENAIKALKNDPVAQKEAARQIMRKYRLSPWAKVVTLAVQAVVLVLLYQVFIGGIVGERVTRTLYSSVDYPGRINTNFYGFDLGARRNLLWAGAAAFYLFASIYLRNRKRPSWEKSDALYAIGLPFATGLALWYLPMVKSLFILTTMIFSDMISPLRFLVFSGRPKKAEAGHH